MQKVKKYQEHLMDAFQFDERDLEANETGLLSEQQRAALMSLYDSALLGFIIALAVAISGFVLWLRVFPSFGNKPSGDASFVFIVGTLIIGGFCWHFGAKTRTLHSDLRENQAVYVEGYVDLSLSIGKNNASYRVGIGARSFPLKQETFLVFKNGDPYRIYYTPHSKQILSVEWLRESD